MRLDPAETGEKETQGRKGAEAASGHPEIARLDWQVSPDGSVVLRGVVSGFFAKQMAQVYVSRVHGVTRIENLVEVR